VDALAQEIVTWLKGLSKGAVVHWYSDQLTRKQPYGIVMAEVMLPDMPPSSLLSLLGCHFRLLTPGPYQVQTHLGRELAVDPPDLTVYMAVQLSPHYKLEGAVPMQPGQPLPLRDEARLAELATQEGRERWQLPGFTAERISAVLAAWTKEHARRRDLRFAWQSRRPRRPRESM